MTTNPTTTQTQNAETSQQQSLTSTGDAQSWHTLEHARNWIARQDREQGTRDEELRTLIAFLTLDETKPVQILDLGAGHGLLTREVLERFPLASVLALDLNPTMIDEGRARLAAYGDRIRYREWDLADAGWRSDAEGRSDAEAPFDTDGPFDAVVSSLALHHLTRERKALLAQQLFERLRPGGLFLNLDYVGPSSERLVERYEQARQLLSPEGQQHGRSGGGRGHGGDSLDAQLDDLRRAGFEDVEVFWKRTRLALFGATKPEAN